MISRLAIGLIRLYQILYPAFLPRVCRFEPTCSSYAIKALSWAAGPLDAAGGVSDAANAAPPIRQAAAAARAKRERGMASSLWRAAAHGRSAQANAWPRLRVPQPKAVCGRAPAKP